MIETWGCQMNEEDSEKMAGMLNSMGYESTGNKEDADIIVFNTCCVRENAELKVYGNLGILKNLKKSKPDLVIAVCGCMMQQKGMAENIKKNYPFVNLIFGTHNIHKFPQLLNNAMQSQNTIIDLSEDYNIEEGIPIKRESKIKAFVTIMYGCNNFCTYCIVPYVRGRERSRKPSDIIKEVSNLSEEGYREITLLGQNVNSYGKGLDEDIDFAKLLTRLSDVEGIERIRFMTSHPKDISYELIDVIKNCSKVCKHVHLPLQSGSSRILKLMNRNYSKEKYLKIADKLKSEIPGIALTTDIIIGFPGETEEDFEETLDVVKMVRFDSAFTFLYSKREGTPAFKMKEQVDERVKHERFNRLLELVNSIALEKNKEYEGKTVRVLVEDISKNDGTKLMGRTDTGKLVNFSFEGYNADDLFGKIEDVKIEEAFTWSLNGKIAK
ncbi:MAG TPA: tRNA (N6-isopentenyl adenosine(37)-C2)-methylthiotransferase MiaB [Clostridiaceae bacterium]|nr:tRNA (N6-isopentenyl adenosine(37)-C2)-methylthiotransferase MiaB [Clostridiaceae bacterium]